jgi:hypothetical protein
MGSKRRFEPVPFDGEYRFVSDADTAGLVQLAKRRKSAQEKLEAAIEIIFAPGTVVHVRTGDHLTRAVVTRQSGERVFVLNEETNRAYWVSVYRLEEFNG